MGQKSLTWDIQTLSEPWLQTMRPGIGARSYRQIIAENFRHQAQIVGIHNAPISTAPAVCGITYPAELSYLAVAVKNARWILELPDDWDEQGSVSYSEATWQKAAQFILLNAIAMFKENGIKMSEPAISNGPEGSIDILWQEGNRTLLLNVPNGDGSLSFYGSDSNGSEIKGTTGQGEKNKWLMVWQMV